MTISIKRHAWTGDPREWTAEEAVKFTIDAADDAQQRLEAQTAMLGKIVQALLDNGKITDYQLMEITAHHFQVKFS